MLICNQEFNFSTLNADDIDRIETAQEHLQETSAAEAARVTAQNLGYADQLRGQCRLIMDYLDEVLGDGASAKLGLTGSDLGKCFDVVKAVREAIAAEKKAATAQFATQPEQPQPMNRAQRRALAKAERHQAPVVRVAEGSAQPAAKNALPAEDNAQPAAVQMVERVDKAARRKQLLAELEALENA